MEWEVEVNANFEDVYVRVVFAVFHIQIIFVLTFAVSSHISFKKMSVNPMFYAVFQNSNGYPKAGKVALYLHLKLAIGHKIKYFQSYNISKRFHL